MLLFGSILSEAAARDASGCAGRDRRSLCAKPEEDENSSIYPNINFSSVHIY